MSKAMTRDKWFKWAVRADNARAYLSKVGEWTLYDEGTYEEITPGLDTRVLNGVLDIGLCTEDKESAKELRKAVRGWEERVTKW